MVSACLAGENCRYDGGANYSEIIARLVDGGLALPVCPERLGGLPTPRRASEIRAGRVINQDGQDWTRAFESGALAALELAVAHGCRIAVLKAKSPSCGPDRIYDGSFTRRLIPGQGVFAAKLRAAGLLLFSEKTFFLSKRGQA